MNNGLVNNRLIRFYKGMLNFEFDKIMKQSSNMHIQQVATNTTILVNKTLFEAV